MQSVRTNPDVRPTQAPLSFSLIQHRFMVPKNNVTGSLCSIRAGLGFKSADTSHARAACTCRVLLTCDETSHFFRAS